MSRKIVEYKPYMLIYGLNCYVLLTKHSWLIYSKGKWDSIHHTQDYSTYLDLEGYGYVRNIKLLNKLFC